MSFELDYGDAVLLDAEELAEGRIGELHEDLLPTLREFVKEPASIEEFLDDDVPSY